MNKLLFWHYFVDETDYPALNKPCFIDVEGYIQIAYWRQDTKTWINPIYGHLPPSYDDSGGIYLKTVKRWAYIPEKLFNN